MPTKYDLQLFQRLPLEMKIAKTKLRIREWVDYYGTNGVYVSFSGGKDSTVLLHIVRQMYPDIEAVFVNTGLEYPEIQSFVKSFDNVTILRPKMRFDEVIRKYGYPFISKEVSQQVYETRKKPNGWASKKFDKNSDYCKRYGDRFCLEKWKPLLDLDFHLSHICCKEMKKYPSFDFEKRTGKKPFIATMAEESALRQTKWLKTGCNAFQAKRETSQPLSFWTKQDILQYIKEEQRSFDICLREVNSQYKITRNLARKWLKAQNYKKFEIASVYGDIVYGEKNGEQYDNLICDCGSKLCTTGCDRTGCIFCGFGAHLEKGESRFERLKKTHLRQYEYCMGGGAYDTDGLWKPTKDGLGMAHCIDEINKIYGKDFIRY